MVTMYHNVTDLCRDIAKSFLELIDGVIGNKTSSVSSVSQSSQSLVIYVSRLMVEIENYNTEFRTEKEELLRNVESLNTLLTKFNNQLIKNY